MPTGGWHDNIGDFDTIEEAKAAVDATQAVCWHIVDTMTKDVVWDEQGKKS